MGFVNYIAQCQGFSCATRIWSITGETGQPSKIDRIVGIVGIVDSAANGRVRGEMGDDPWPA
jgi:membrane protein implicated in regulation of membrane protease activity